MRRDTRKQRWDHGTMNTCMINNNDGTAKKFIGIGIRVLGV